MENKMIMNSPQTSGVEIGPISVVIGQTDYQFGDNELREVRGKIIAVETDPWAIRKLREMFAKNFDIIFLMDCQEETIKKALLYHTDCSLLLIQRKMAMYLAQDIDSCLGLLMALSVPVIFHDRMDLRHPFRFKEKAFKTMGLR